jgi:MinD superfamily P-loop ATPase
MNEAAVVAVAAGKGGTGKTLVATSLALALHERMPGAVSLLDCDVEEPNAHLLLRPEWASEEPVLTRMPVVDIDRCTRCGVCADACHTSAIAVVGRAVLVFGELCSGCGLCAYLCPEHAIDEIERSVGAVRVGRTPDGLRVASGALAVGQRRATPVIRAVRRQVRRDGISILDAPPGTACPMQEAVEGADLCWLVTEPTPFGRSDLLAAREACDALGVPSVVVVNRDGIGGARDDLSRVAAGAVVLRIPHDRRIAEAYARGDALVVAQPEWKARLLAVWDRTRREQGVTRRG